MEQERDEFPSQIKPEASLFSLRRIWLNILLFIITVFSTFFVGISLGVSYKYAEELAGDAQVVLNFKIFSDPQIFSLALVYVVVLMGILLGHELGHFLTCQYYKIKATLPYFIPAPTLIGTLGAFIRIKTPITRKHQLFDIGVAGPLTGFILSLPALVYGISLSKAVPPLIQEGSLVFGEPLLFKFVGSFVFKDVPLGFDVVPHPMAFAAWVGILVTSFNLFPVGQLDGGHVSYALLGPKSRNLSRFFLVVFGVMGIFFWFGWFIWAFILFFLGLKHPRIFDEATSLSPGRKFIGFIMILIFIVSFIPDPIKGFNLFDLLRQFGLAIRL